MKRLEFETVEVRDGQSPEFPLDFIAPGYSYPSHAFIVNERGNIEEIRGDYIAVPMKQYDETDIHSHKNKLKEFADHYHELIEKTWKPTNKSRLHSQLIHVVNEDATKHGFIYL